MYPPNSTLPSCDVCGFQLNEETRLDPDRDTTHYDCSHCGKFGVTRNVRDDCLTADFRKSDKAHLLSHFIRKKQDSNTAPLLDLEEVSIILAKGKFPTAKEQAEYLIRWLGEKSHEPGAFVPVSFESHGAIIGAKSENGFRFIVNGLMQQGLLVRRNPDASRPSATLTFDGWEHFQELKRGIASGRKAFMAMPFGKDDVKQMYQYFREAADKTGFMLETLEERPKAGLIDARIRVEIQGARFLVADLTYQNNGVYWEAGYAEGLGKPVIYTCNQEQFENIHFDTNHHLTIKWALNNPQEAMDRFVATVRFTLPDAMGE